MSHTPQHIFEWQGRDQQGQLVRGRQHAHTQQEVLATLRNQGVWLTHLRSHPQPRRRLRQQGHIARLTRQMATMLKAGVPLLQCLDMLHRSQSRAPLRAALQHLRHELTVGHALHAAMAQHPQYFSPLYLHLIEAGESSGTLDLMLERLAVHLENSHRLQRRLRTAMTYPAALLLVSLSVVTVILVYVIPAFESVFASFGAELPQLTRAVLGLSEGLRQHGLWLFLGWLASAIVATQLWRRHSAYRQRLEALALHVPLLGRLWRNACLVRWSRTLASLLSAGIPLVEALESVAGAAGHSQYAAATQQLRQTLTTGTSFSESMQAHPIFPHMLRQMVAVGEESGALDTMLHKAADFFDESVDTAVQRLSSLLEPALILVLGGMIGVIVIAMYLPLFTLGHMV